MFVQYLSIPSRGITESRVVRMLVAEGKQDFQFPLAGSHSGVLHVLVKTLAEPFNSLSRDHGGTTQTTSDVLTQLIFQFPLAGSLHELPHRAASRDTAGQLHFQFPLAGSL